MNPIEAARESAMKRQHLMPSLPLGVAKASFVAKLKENKDGPRGGAMHGEEIVKSIGGNVDLLANVAFMERFGEFPLLVILLKKRFRPLFKSIRKEPSVQVLDGGMYKYLPKYAHACTQRTPIGLLDLIEAEFEKNATGIRGYDLEELYYEAKKDLEKLVSEGKIMMYRDRELTCDVFFPIFKQYLKDVPKSLKESWHRVPIPDPAKLKAELKDMGHLAAAPPPLPTVSRRKKKAQPVEKKQRKVRDEYNHHVDPALMNDDWRNTVSEKANIYGKN